MTKPLLPLATELTRGDAPSLERHFLALDAEDRRLRFGAPQSDTAIRAYVERIEFGRDAVFGVWDAELQLLGVAHLARAGKRAELGLSVLSPHRRRGLGGTLLSRACMRARNWGQRALFVYCLSENEAVMRLARKHGMAIVALAGEAHAWLKLPPADAASFFDDVSSEALARFDLALKSQLRYARRLSAWHR
jgi:RimJ/RimL family protein N-acetyltransferase